MTADLVAYAAALTPNQAHTIRRENTTRPVDIDVLVELARIIADHHGLTGAVDTLTHDVRRAMTRAKHQDRRHQDWPNSDWWATTAKALDTAALATVVKPHIADDTYQLLTAPIAAATTAAA